MRINPCPIVIPCHRVIGKNGLGGYGFGIQKKLLLLKLEGVMVC
ncbi:MAG TPA: methylated-DNA--[protein]-cysteine S-methyltransferase [bacterium]|nr:methylated-DNA--[protein]-cysteine S-methyltransferase [bacterium]